MSKKSTLKTAKVAVKVLEKEAIKIEKVLQLIKSFQGTESSAKIAEIVDQLLKYDIVDNSPECSEFITELEDLRIELDNKNK